MGCGLCGCVARHIQLNASQQLAAADGCRRRCRRRPTQRMPRERTQNLAKRACTRHPEHAKSAGKPRAGSMSTSMWMPTEVRAVGTKEPAAQGSTVGPFEAACGARGSKCGRSRGSLRRKGSRSGRCEGACGAKAVRAVGSRARGRACLASRARRGAHHPRPHSGGAGALARCATGRGVQRRESARDQKRGEVDQ